MQRILVIVFIGVMNTIYAGQGEPEKYYTDFELYQKPVPEKTLLEVLPKELWQRLGAIAYLELLATPITNTLLKYKEEFTDIELQTCPWNISCLVQKEVSHLKIKEPFVSNPLLMGILLEKVLDQLVEKCFFPECSTIHFCHIKIGTILSLLGIATKEAIAWLSEILHNPYYATAINLLIDEEIDTCPLRQPSWPGQFKKNDITSSYDYHPASLDVLKQVIDTFVQAGIKLQKTRILKSAPSSDSLPFAKYLVDQGARFEPNALTEAQQNLDESSNSIRAAKTLREIVLFVKKHQK